LTTWDVVSETVTLLLYRGGRRPTAAFVREVLPHLIVLSPTEDEKTSALQFFMKRSRERRLSLCDCLSFVIATGRLNLVKCLSFNKNFRRLGLRVLG
jgi:predicted nucleic acid-binding protein